MRTRTLAVTLGALVGISACTGGGAPGSPAKLPIYEMLLWVHRLQRANGTVAGNENDITFQMQHSETIWGFGSQPGTVEGSGCFILAEPGPRDLPLWKNWPSRRVLGRNIDASTVFLGDRLYSDSLNAPNTQRDSPNTRANWDALIADRNNFVSTNSDYQHFQRLATGTGVHVYYTEEIVARDFGILRYFLGVAGTGGGVPTDPNIVAVLDETINPVNGLVTVAHELGHILGIRHDDPPHPNERHLMARNPDAAFSLPNLVTGGLTAATTVEPNPSTTDCGRARSTGRSRRLFTAKI